MMLRCVIYETLGNLTWWTSNYTYWMIWISESLDDRHFFMHSYKINWREMGKPLWKSIKMVWKSGELWDMATNGWREKDLHGPTIWWCKNKFMSGLFIWFINWLEFWRSYGVTGLSGNKLANYINKVRILLVEINEL